MPEKILPDSRLRELARKIAAYDIKHLIQPALAAPFNFEEYESFFRNLLSFYQEIADTNLSNVPPDRLEDMLRKSESVLQSLNQVRDWNVTSGGDTKQERSSRIGRLLSDWREAYLESVHHLAFAKISASSIDEEVKRLRSFTDSTSRFALKIAGEYTEKTSAAEKQLAGKIEELDKVLAAAREASGKAAVSRQAKEFEDEANQCLRASRLWFGGTIAAVALSLVVVYLMFLSDLHPQKGVTPQQAQSATVNQIQVPASADLSGKSHAVTIEVLQQTVARILIVTLLYSAVVWCARNYFASRHNYTVNRHRRNAMQTFRAFVEGTKDLATQDFILRQAASCAFAPQQSGYLKDESLPTPAPASQIVDVVKPGDN